MPVLLPALAIAALAGPGCHNDTVTAPTLSATCSANPASGPAPLRVTFGLDVAGAQGSFSVAIDYGDGASGSDAAQAHVYATSGSYSPAFTVTTATQSARCSTAVAVAAPQPAPTPAANRPPEAVFFTNPPARGGTVTGKAPFTVEFNLCRTTDPEHDPLRFSMDLNGDGVFEYQGSTGADCRHEASYPAGTHAAQICVTDVDCNTWPACFGNATLHPLQCGSYLVVVTP